MGNDIDDGGRTMNLPIDPVKRNPFSKCKLLECPFCGITPKKAGAWVTPNTPLDVDAGEGYFDKNVVECVNCGIQIPLDVWNKRK